MDTAGSAQSTKDGILIIGLVQVPETQSGHYCAALCIKLTAVMLQMIHFLATMHLGSMQLATTYVDGVSTHTYLTFT